MATLKNIPFAQTLALEALVPYRKGRILSRALCSDGPGGIVLFSLDAGEEISEETIPEYQLIVVVDGSVQVTVGRAVSRLSAGECIAIEPHVMHAILALTPCRYVHLYTHPEA